VEFLFPHYFLLPFFSSMSSYRIRPLGPRELPVRDLVAHLRRRRARAENTVSADHPAIRQPGFPADPAAGNYSNIPLQQKGLHAGGFEFMRLSKDKEGLISNYQRIIDGYSRELRQRTWPKLRNCLAAISTERFSISDSDAGKGK